MNPQLWWYLARATGVVAWFGAVGAVVAGLALASRIGGRQVPPAWLLAIHRHLGAVALGFTAAHLGFLVADTYIQFDLLDLLVPMRAGWKPGPVAWGIVTMWVLVLVEVTSLLRRRLPASLWRSVHLLSYLGAVAATVHMFTAGTDAVNPVLRWSVIATVSLSAGFLIYRLLMPRRRRRPAAATSTSAGAAA